MIGCVMTDQLNTVGISMGPVKCKCELLGLVVILLVYTVAASGVSLVLLYSSKGK